MVVIIIKGNFIKMDVVNEINFRIRKYLSKLNNFSIVLVIWIFNRRSRLLGSERN